MRQYRFRRPPAALRNAQLDNIALVPASMLPFKQQWQRMANRLPKGSTLIILPATRSRQRQTCETVAQQLRKVGKPVTTVSAAHFTHGYPHATNS
jgi:hypothetical protein